MAKLLLAHIDDALAERIRALLESQGHRVISPAPERLGDVRPGTVDAVLLAIGDDLQLAATAQRLPVIAIGSQNSVREAVSAMRQGAIAYVGTDDVDSALAAEISACCIEPVLPQIEGSSAQIAQLRDQVDRVAGSDVPVVLTGQAGCGKERIARRLHLLSPRRSKPLISYNCASSVDAILDRDLFGDGGSGGALSAAAQGTLFLDEITALSAQAQGRLLATLDNLDINYRLIVGTRRDLAAAAETGDFRDDLLLRLNVVTLTVPSLSDRIGDIDELADACLARTQARFNRTVAGFSSEARDDMHRYHWPGNLRELENAIERAVILSDGGAIDTDALAIRLDATAAPAADGSAPSGSAELEKGTLEDYFVSFVVEHQDKMTETEIAKSLGISRKSLWERRQRLNIPRKRGRARKASQKGAPSDS